MREGTQGLSWRRTKLGRQGVRLRSRCCSWFCCTSGGSAPDIMVVVGDVNGCKSYNWSFHAQGVSRHLGKYNWRPCHLLTETEKEKRQRQTEAKS